MGLGLACFCVGDEEVGYQNMAGKALYLIFRNPIIRVSATLLRVIDPVVHKRVLRLLAGACREAFDNTIELVGLQPFPDFGNVIFDSFVANEVSHDARNEGRRHASAGFVDDFVVAFVRRCLDVAAGCDDHYVGAVIGEPGLFVGFVG